MLVQLDEVPFATSRIVRFWDFASTKPRPGRRDPDWTAGALVAEADGEFWIADMVRLRDKPGTVEATVWQTWVRDYDLTGAPVPVRIELEGGSGGAFTIHGVRRYMTGQWSKARANGFVDEATGLPVPDTRPDVQGFPTGGVPKPQRARKVSLLAQAGNVHIVEAHWTDVCLDELDVFPDPQVHDDQVDAISGAVRFLSGPAGAAGIAVDRLDEARAPSTLPDPIGASPSRRPARRKSTDPVTFVVK